MSNFLTSSEQPKVKTVNTFEDLEAALLENDKGDTSAYDGSRRRPKRALTPRERDVLCRILTFVIKDPAYMFEELGRLQLIRHVIDPRNSTRSA